MKTTLLTLSLFFFALSAHSAKFDRLGQRSSTCQNLTGDDFIIEYDSRLVSETQNLFNDDQLKSAVITGGSCLRVGTEVRLMLAGETIPYLGRALIDSIETLTASALKKKKTQYTQSAIDDFLKANRNEDYALIQLRVVEKVQETFVNTQYERLPTCFPSNGDWQAMRLQDGDEALLAEIQQKKTTAQIWNGTFNCYKVGVRAAITMPSKKGEILGNIIPSELYLVHYTNLTSKHAKLLDKSLSSLKKEMAEKKDIEGGYVTMVVFDYEKEKPPQPLAEEDEDE